MSDRSLDRRTVLRASGLAAVGGLTALAGCSGGGGGGGDTATAEPTPTPGGGGGGTRTATEPSGSAADAPFGGWLSGVTNFDGVVDRTGSSEVRVKVGTQANGGYYGFGPAAVRVSPGTTVTWEWTGKGGSHNVVAKDGSYESELVAEAGHTFTHTFESTGTSKYYCMPHKALGMKGVVVVE